MAEGWVEHLHGGRIRALSAGIETHGLNPHAVAVMLEVGVDISHHVSKHIDTINLDDVDHLISVCGHADETCPTIPGRVARHHVGFDDPPRLAEAARDEEERLNAYRRVRDSIRDFVVGLPDYLRV